MNLTPRQEESLDAGSHISVTAGAGSGKTRILVERYVRILGSDPAIRPRNILALTFTEKAASEMKDRVRGSVKELAAAEGGRWYRVLEELDSADISTIHSFCTKIVRALPVPCGVDPDFRVLTDTETSQIINDVLNEMFTSEGEESPALRRLIVDYGMGWTASLLKGLLRDMGKTSLEVGSGEFRKASLEHLEAGLKISGEEVFRELSDVIPFLNDIKNLPVPEAPPDRAVRLMVRMGPVFSFMEEYNETREDMVKLLSLLHDRRDVLMNQGGKERRAGNLGNSRVWQSDLGRIREAFSVIFGFVFRHQNIFPFVVDNDLSRRASERLGDISEVFSRFRERFQEEKAKANGLDFSDQISLAISLLERDEEGILSSLRSRFDHLLVDEFQDTDPDQWKLVNLLWGEGSYSKLFIVGDPKQSIYGFRSADVRLFLKAKETLGTHGQGRSVILDRNFRSRREIMEFVNSLFPSIMGEGSEKWGVPFDPLDPHHGGGGSVSVTVVLGTRGSEAREGAEAARTIKKAIRGWSVFEDGAERPIRFSDIAVLVPTRRGINHYEDAFRLERIPFQVYKGKGFFERQEVDDVLTLLAFLSNPLDDLALAGLLKGPFFGHSDEDLMRVASQRGGTLLYKLSLLHEHAADHSMIIRFMELAGSLPPHMALGEILRISGVYASMGGRREARNLDRLLEWARGEITANTIQELASRLKRLVESPPREGEPPLNVEEDSVTMMTIHSAKGLEWPMVLVLGMNHEPKGGWGSPYILDPDRGLSIKVADHNTGEFVKTPSFTLTEEESALKETEERKRQLYVACTRARDHLVLSGAVPVDQGGMEREPHGLFRFIWDSMELSISEIDQGVKMVGDVPVRLIGVRPDSVSEEEVDEEERPDIRIADSCADLPLLRTVPSSGRTFLRSPSSMMRTEEDRRGLPRDHLSPSTDIPPDEFGDMVHSILQGRDPDRVLAEYGWKEMKTRVMEAVDSIGEQLLALDIESSFHEVEIVNTLKDETGEEMGVLGRVDLLARRKDGSYLIIDFKTGIPREEHHRQLELYRDLLRGSVDGEIGTLVLYSRGWRGGQDTSIDEP